MLSIRPLAISFPISSITSPIILNSHLLYIYQDFLVTVQVFRGHVDLQIYRGTKRETVAQHTTPKGDLVTRNRRSYLARLITSNIYYVIEPLLYIRPIAKETFLRQDA